MDHQDHVQTAEADLLMENVLSKPSDKFDSKHATDFIQNEVQSYDNVFVAKKPEVKENGDHLGLEQTEQISPVDLMNSSTHELTSSLLLTQQVDALDNKMTDIPMHSTAESPDADLLDVADISPNTVSGPYADLLREVADISPIKTVDLVDIEKPSKDLLVEETKFSPTIPEPDIIGDNAQFHLREKTVDHVEELIKPSDISVVPDSCDLISNKPKETKSTPSPVEPVVIEAEPPKSEPKGNEATETIKCVKPVTAKGNPSEKSEIGPKDFFTKYGLVEAYIYWRDPKLSGIIFGSGLVLLLSLAYFSLISVVANAGLAILTCAIVFRIYKDIMQAVQKTPQTHPYSVFLNRDIALPQEKVHELIDTLILHINACLGELRRLFLVEDMIESLKFALVLWILTYVGSWFNGLTLVIIGFVALFTLPKVYENNKVQIDQNLALVRAKVEELANKIREALPAPLRRKVPEKKE